MRYIAHRGNINGRNIERENSPKYIKETLNKWYEVELDIWYVDKTFYFGHDEPTYEVELYDFLNSLNSYYHDKLWFHCKNIEALSELKNKKLNYFWHENDKYTLTSTQNIWTYPNQKLTENSICVLPEISNYSEKELKICYGICSDYIENYKN